MANPQVNNGSLLETNTSQQTTEPVATEPVAPSTFHREFEKQKPVQEVAWGIDIPGLPKIEIPVPQIPGQEKGPFLQQVQALDAILEKNGHPRGNVQPLDLGKDEKGNAYAMQRTENGIQITATKPDGSTYQVEINGRNGQLTSATYKDAQGHDGGTPSTETINKIINTGITLGVSKNAAPDIDKPSTPKPKAPEI